MKKKEIIALIVAAAIFVATGITGVRSAERLNERSAEALSSFAKLGEAMSGEETAPTGKYLEQLDICGGIMYEGGLSEDCVDVSGIIDELYDLSEDENNVGLLLYIDSPGGTMDAADDLYYALMDYKAATNRPIYCYFNTTACSGGYYVAMPADEICANRNCLCVNIGVYITTYNFAELYEKLGVEQIAIKSGENKGIGLEGQSWTEEQLGIYQSIVDESYEQFVEVVAEGRGMTPQKVRELDDGREMTAKQALAAGFIDSIDRYDAYTQTVMNNFDEDTELWEYSGEESWIDQFTDYFRQFQTHSDTELLQEFAESRQGLKVMAYAGNY